ncbi:hypothetical protein [Providencia vermicola]|uniref:hypothetical protein n=1 Tax=Providencia vermicola TaxID=333965 RepID=UPI001CEDD0CB|nr:hypothetical protein [Providencia vermicola]
MIQPITKVSLGNKQLLVPLTIHHSVEKVKSNVDTFSFNNQYQITKSDRYKFDSTSRTYSVMSACWRDHYGTGKLQTHLKFGDKSATNELEFYWEGMNRSPHTPSI